MLKRRRLIKLITAELRAMRDDSGFVPTCRADVETELGRRLALPSVTWVQDIDINDIIELVLFIINLIISLFFKSAVEGE